MNLKTIYKLPSYKHLMEIMISWQKLQIKLIIHRKFLWTTKKTLMYINHVESNSNDDVKTRVVIRPANRRIFRYYQRLARCYLYLPTFLVHLYIYSGIFTIYLIHFVHAKGTCVTSSSYRLWYLWQSTLWIWTTH